MLIPSYNQTHSHSNPHSHIHRPSPCLFHHYGQQGALQKKSFSFGEPAHSLNFTYHCNNFEPILQFPIPLTTICYAVNLNNQKQFMGIFHFFFFNKQLIIVMGIVASHNLGFSVGRIFGYSNIFIYFQTNIFIRPNMRKFFQGKYIRIFIRDLFMLKDIFGYSFVQYL